jgi:hypothetical protein
MLELIRTKIKDIVAENMISDDNVVITAQVLTPGEAIGNPEHDDYPLLKGRERLMEARFKNSRGVAFSDMFGNFEAGLDKILNMELGNNFRRAIFVATINAVLRELNLIEGSEHCRNEDLTICAGDLAEFIRENYGEPRVFLCGLQPRFAEVLSANFPTRITDLDEANLGKNFNGAVVSAPELQGEYLSWCELVFATGSTFVNDTFPRLARAGKKIVVYGVTGAGPAYLLEIPRYCPRGR